jgi:hypothetical protein
MLLRRMNGEAVEPGLMSVPIEVAQSEGAVAVSSAAEGGTGSALALAGGREAGVRRN